MKISEAINKLKSALNIFKKQEAEEKSNKWKKIAIIVGIIVALILVGFGIFLLVRKLKKRRMEKETQEELEEHYATDPDADEFSEDTEEEEEDVLRF